MKGHVLWHIFQEAALATFRNKRKQKLILEYILKTCWKKLCLQMCCVYSLPPCLSFLLLKAQKDLCVWNLSSGRMEVFALCPSLVRGGRNEFRQIQTCMFSTLGYLLTFSLWGWWKMIDEIKTSTCLWETSELAVYGGQQTCAADVAHVFSLLEDDRKPKNFSLPLWSLKSDMSRSLPLSL